MAGPPALNRLAGVRFPSAPLNVATATVAYRRTTSLSRTRADLVGAILASPEVAALVGELEALQCTGRKGYGPRVLLGACLVKAIYAIPTWTRTTALIAEHAALQDAIGGTPSEWSTYRFMTKLRRHNELLSRALERILEALHHEHPQFGEEIGIDATDMPAYSSGQKYTSAGPRTTPFSDPDAAWGFRSAVSTRKGGGFFGFKAHVAVCARTGLPLAWRVEGGNRQETIFALDLLDSVMAHGFAPTSCAFDKGYDHHAVYAGCEERDCRPIIPMRSIKTKKPSEPLACEHGLWTFGGADFKRHAAKWRCPTGECRPKSRWVKADRRNTLVPRGTERWRRLYRGRAAVEREFGRLKNEYGLAPLRVRGIDRVQLHVDLVMLARLAHALARARETNAAA